MKNLSWYLDEIEKKVKKKKNFIVNGFDFRVIIDEKKKNYFYFSFVFTIMRKLKFNEINTIMIF